MGMLCLHKAVSRNFFLCARITYHSTRMGLAGRSFFLSPSMAEMAWESWSPPSLRFIIFLIFHYSERVFVRKGGRAERLGLFVHDENNGLIFLMFWESD